MANDFPSDTFQYVVLAHCSWYFASMAQLRRTLTRVRPWARRLCFAEWDLRPDHPGQLPHLLAVLLQGQIEAAGARGTGNIRTPFSRERLLGELAATGWRVTSERRTETGGLQDADWETATALATVADEVRLATLPGPVRDFVTSQADVLRATARERGNEPLPSYVVTAERV